MDCIKKTTLEYFPQIVVYSVNGLGYSYHIETKHSKGNEMSIITKKIKLFGKTEILFQVVDGKGEVLQVLCSKEEAQEWINAQ